MMTMKLIILLFTITVSVLSVLGQIDDVDQSTLNNTFVIISMKNAPFGDPYSPCVGVFIETKWILTSLRCFCNGTHWISKKIKYLYIHPDYKNNYKKLAKKAFKIPDKNCEENQLALVELRDELPVDVTVFKMSNNSVSELEEVNVFSFTKTAGRELNLNVFNLNITEESSFDETFQNSTANVDDGVENEATQAVPNDFFGNIVTHLDTETGEEKLFLGMALKKNNKTDVVHVKDFQRFIFELMKSSNGETPAKSTDTNPES